MLLASPGTKMKIVRRFVLAENTSKIAEAAT
jgi:hypothetical protein